MNKENVLNQPHIEQLIKEQSLIFNTHDVLYDMILCALKEKKAQDVENLFLIADKLNISIDPSGIAISAIEPSISIIPMDDQGAGYNHGGQPNIIKTFLHLASDLSGEDGSKKVRILIDRGASIWQTEEYGYVPLCNAAEKGNLESVKMLLEAYPNETGDNLCHPPYILTAGSSFGEPDDILQILKLFEELGADPNLIPSDNSFFKIGGDKHRCSNVNSLMAASEHGYVDRVELILRNPRTNPNRRRLADGLSALDLVLKKLCWGKTHKYRSIAHTLIAHPVFDQFKCQ